MLLVRWRTVVLLAGALESKLSPKPELHDVSGTEGIMRLLFGTHPDAKPASRGAQGVSASANFSRLRVGAIVFRSLLLLVLLLMAARVSAPQHVGSTWHDIPFGDFVRALLGVAFCVWMLVELFILPKDPAAYRTWVYLGVTLLPLGVLCLLAIW
jgi:hypothetical protein